MNNAHVAETAVDLGTAAVDPQHTTGDIPLLQVGTAVVSIQPIDPMSRDLALMMDALPTADSVIVGIIPPQPNDRFTRYEITVGDHPASEVTFTAFWFSADHVADGREGTDVEGQARPLLQAAAPYAGTEVEKSVSKEDAEHDVRKILDWYGQN